MQPAAINAVHSTMRASEPNIAGVKTDIFRVAANDVIVCAVVALVVVASGMNGRPL